MSPLEGDEVPGDTTLEDVRVGGVKTVSGLRLWSVGGRLPKPLSWSEVVWRSSRMSELFMRLIFG